MLLNVRKPDQNLGDLKALVGALNTGERKVQAMVAQVRRRTRFRAGLDGLLDYAEHQAREVLRSIPDGEYLFADYADEDGETGNPCRLALTLRIAGDEAVLDFTGTDPQLTSSLNVPTGSDPRHTLLLVGVYYVLYTLNPQLVLNAGLTRPFTCIVPEGTVLNPALPGRGRACAASPARGCAASSSAPSVWRSRIGCRRRRPASSSIVNVMTTDDKRTHRTVIAAINPVVGGGGGMPHRDGTNGSGADSAYLKNTPIEINEAEVPVQFLRYGLHAGFGRRRALARRARDRHGVQASSPRTAASRSRNRDRSRFRPWGILGGGPGEPSNLVVNPGTRAGEGARQPGHLHRRAGRRRPHPFAGRGRARFPRRARARSACSSTSSAATCRPRGRRWITASCSATGKWTRPPPPHGAPP